MTIAIGGAVKLQLHTNKLMAIEKRDTVWNMPHLKLLDLIPSLPYYLGYVFL
jgi:hypothetical protein